jgi:hypothetical protein
MAVSLVILDPPVQSNDATTVRFQDDTGVYDAVDNTSGWGTPNEEVTDIVAVTTTTVGKYHLTLDIVVTTSDSTETTYDTIDLYTEFGPFSSVTDLVFDITPALLLDSGVALGDSDDQLPDGWYVATYTLSEADTSTEISSATKTLLVDGVVRTLIYDKMRQVPYSHDFERFYHDIKEWGELLDPIYYFSKFHGMLAEVTTAKKSEILSMLATLEILTSV